jgi:hypothetical protein
MLAHAHVDSSSSINFKSDRSYSSSHALAIEGTTSTPRSARNTACADKKADMSNMHMNKTARVSQSGKPTPATLVKSGVPTSITFPEGISGCGRVNSDSSKHNNTSRDKKRGEVWTDDEAWGGGTDGKTEARRSPSSDVCFGQIGMHDDDWEQQQQDPSGVVKLNSRVHMRVHVHASTQGSLLRHDGDVVDDWEQLEQDENKDGGTRSAVQFCGGKDGGVADSWGQSKQDENKDGGTHGAMKFCSGKDGDVADNWEQLELKERRDVGTRGAVQVFSGKDGDVADNWGELGQNARKYGDSLRDIAQICSSDDAHVVDDWEQLEQDENKDGGTRGAVKFCSSKDADVADNWEQLGQEESKDGDPRGIVQICSSDDAHVVDDWEKLVQDETTDGGTCGLVQICRHDDAKGVVDGQRQLERGAHKKVESRSIVHSRGGDKANVVDGQRQLAHSGQKIIEPRRIVQMRSGDSGDDAKAVDGWGQQDVPKIGQVRGIVQICSVDDDDDDDDVVDDWEQLDQKERKDGDQHGIVQIRSSDSAHVVEDWEQLLEEVPQNLSESHQRDKTQILSGYNAHVVDDLEHLEQDARKNRDPCGVVQVCSSEDAHAVDDWEKLAQDTRKDRDLCNIAHSCSNIAQSCSHDDVNDDVVDNWEQHASFDSDMDASEVKNLDSKDRDLCNIAQRCSNIAQSCSNIAQSCSNTAQSCSDDDDVVDNWEQHASFDSDIDASEFKKIDSDSKQTCSQMSVYAYASPSNHDDDIVQRDGQSRIVKCNSNSNINSNRSSNNNNSSSNSKQQNSEQPPCVYADAQKFEIVGPLTSLEEWDAKWRQVYGTFCAEMGLLEDLPCDEYADGESLLTQEELNTFQAHYGNALIEARDKGTGSKRLLVACADSYANVLNCDVCHSDDSDSSEDDF